MRVETTKVGRRGTVVIPAPIRRSYGFEEGSLVIMEARLYTPERKAEFLLNNTITPEDYAAAVKEVRRMGLNPKKIPHKKPEGA